VTTVFRLKTLKKKKVFIERGCKISPKIQLICCRQDQENVISQNMMLKDEIKATTYELQSLNV